MGWLSAFAAWPRPQIVNSYFYAFVEPVGGFGKIYICVLGTHAAYVKTLLVRLSRRAQEIVRISITGMGTVTVVGCGPGCC
jgi:hypothetical protein